MKKLLCFALAVLMVLSMAACGGKKESKKEGLQVGFGRGDITPTNNVPLAGYGSVDNRISTEVMDPLYATCISVFDGQDQVLIYTVDNIYMSEDVSAATTKAISEATGVAESNIFISATHTHSAPDVRYTGTENADAMAAYMEVWYAGFVAAGKDALKDQSAATMSATKFETDHLNFVRHYYQGATDTYMGDNFGDGQTSTITDYAEEGDKEMVLVKFERKKGKNILLMNFQGHPCFTGGMTKTVVSADLIGSVRTVIEKEQDVHFAYFTGAAGNQNFRTYLAADNAIVGQYAEFMPFTKELVRQATEAMNAGMTPIEGFDVKVNTYTYTGNVSHVNEDKLEIAKELSEGFTKSGNREMYNKMAVEAGFLSIYDCNGVVRRAALPDTLDMEMSTLSIGGLALVVAPFEMFSTHSNHIKANSPYDFTMILSCADNVRGYIPSQKMYEEGCYESTTANYAAGTGEIVADKYVEMLKELKN